MLKVLGSASVVYLGVSLFTITAIAIVAAVWFTLRFAVRACWRWIWRQMSVRRAMKGFDRNLQRILAPHPSERGDGHSAADNNKDSP